MSKLPAIICTHLSETNSNIISGHNQSTEHSLLSSSTSSKDLDAPDETGMLRSTVADFQGQEKYSSLQPLCPTNTTRRSYLEPAEKGQCLVQRRHHKSLELSVDQFQLAPKRFQLRRTHSDGSSCWSADPSRHRLDSSRNHRLSNHLSSGSLRRVVSDQTNISSDDKETKTCKNLSNFGTNNAQGSYIEETYQELPAAWFSKVQRMPNGHQNINKPQPTRTAWRSQADNRSMCKLNSPIRHCPITKPSQLHWKLFCNSRCQWYSAPESSLTIGSSCSIKLAASCTSKNTPIFKELKERSKDTNLFWYSR